MSTEEDYVVKAYNIDKKSTYAIAKEFNTYPNRIRRILFDAGVIMRTKSEAQKEALDNNRHTHPTKGKKRSETTKIKISESVAKKWSNMPEEERGRRSKIAKENWDNMPTLEREEFRRLASEAVRESAEHGSKLERFLLMGLRVAGFKPEFHRTQLVSSEKLEMDIFLPEHNVVIEVDGPAHFFPIWGEENLARHLLSDSKKNGLLINEGYAIIRIKHLVKSLSKIHERKVLAKVLETLKTVKAKFPEPNQRLIEIEVK